MKNIFLWKTDTYINPEIPSNMPPIVYFLLYGFKGPVAKLFKKSLFQNYIIPDTHIGEDLIVNAQVFSIVQAGKLQKIDEIVYVYDRRTDGAINSAIKCMKNYNSYLDDPSIKSRLWVKQYFDTAGQSESVIIACLYLVYEAIMQYIRFCRKNIKKNEIILFYREYHKKLINSKCLKNTPIRERIIVPIFYFSMPLGKAYIIVLEFLYCIKRFVFRQKIRE